MKKLFTQKMRVVLALGLVFSFPQLMADNVNDYTDRLVNPSFETYADGTVLDVSNTANPDIISNALRGIPPGWEGTYIPNPSSGNLGYGINRGAINKDGYNVMWCSQNPFPENFELYRKVADLPAGTYRISCRMSVFSGFLTTQRIFAQTINVEGNTVANVVQYFAKDTNYVANRTPGETDTFADWEMNSSTADSEARLKPMFVDITVAEGDTLKLGIRSSDRKKDGTHAGGQNGFIKADDFRITLLPLPVDTDDYTGRIVNPSFELEDAEGTPVVIKAHNDKRDTPYGWSDIHKEGLQPATGVISYGVNADANDTDGARSCWAHKSPFPDHFTLYQDITGLPAGKYRLSCSMFVQDGMLTTQRLFANNNVQYYGKSDDYSELNLTADEVNTYAGWGTTADAFANGKFLRKLSVEVNLPTEESSLRIGVKTGNLKKDGTTAASAAGYFKVDNFRLKRTGDPDTGLDRTDKPSVTVIAQKGGFRLTGNDTPARLQVITLPGQTVYSNSSAAAQTRVALPQGLYIVRLIVDGKESTLKVLVR
jgi:hypothetical protein